MRSQDVGENKMNETQRLLLLDTWALCCYDVDGQPFFMPRLPPLSHTIYFAGTHLNGLELDDITEVSKVYILRRGYITKVPIAGRG